VLGKEHFGEGLALVPRLKSKLPSLGGGHFIQITYKHRKGFIYHDDLTGPLREFEFDTVTGQGWGLAYDSSRRELVVSDGSEYLFIWDADSLVEKRYLRVHLPVHGEGDIEHPETSSNTVPLKFLNELEVVPGGGFVLANVWYDDRVVKIDLSSGMVVAAYDFRTLRPQRRRGEDCMNGLAFDYTTGDLYVTGKLWSNTYRIETTG
jgi:glutaminyl-peptide cyclotransferase